MTFPEDLYYTRDHEWLRVEQDGTTAVIGITDFAQSELGDIVFIELEPIGTRVEAESVFGTVEAVKTVSELFAPVSGEIVAVNEDLDSTPEAVNDDPYGNGWMVKMEMSSPADVDSLLSSFDYKELVAA
jgi:glycine cleavage system H protein